MKWKGHPKVLSRQFYFNINANLEDLTNTINDLIEAGYEHLYGITDCKRNFYTDIPGADGLDSSRYRLDQLPYDNKRTLEYTYDFGEDYEFILKIGTAQKEIEGNHICHPIKGYGIGIIEDDISALYDRIMSPREFEDSEEYTRELSVEEMECSLGHERNVKEVKDIDESFYEKKNPEPKDSNPCRLERLIDSPRSNTIYRLMMKAFMKEPWKEKWTETQCRNRLYQEISFRNSACFLLKAGNKTVGYCGGYLITYQDKIEFQLLDFFVDQDSEIKHLGTSMMELLIKELKKMEAFRIVLSTRGSLDGFYSKFGFEKAEDYLMSKTIKETE